MNNSKVFMHFRPEERPFVERCFDWITSSRERSMVVITPFLDPREQFIYQSICNREVDVVSLLDGGYPVAERKRVILAPDYFSIDESWSDVAFLRIESSDRRLLEHPDVLGAVLGLGIKREMIGDIQPHNHGCDLVVAREMSDFLPLHLSAVGRKKVTVQTIARDQFFYSEPDRITKNIIVASLRLDAIISEAFHISRSKSQLMIKGKKCKINWQLVDQSDKMVEPGDTISVRGSGRICVICVDKMTKKGRIVVRILSLS
ncbi:RNA-binding protein [Thermoactinomyces sp. DSM 45892]|uniref:YlmH family RNA-binding protein n=1 Tax=Thermoactinomyces sp. DSM 45892 TaxID=1882753 RepID=UPI00089777D4|nr:YlmH/Sll1252 family protein [Thermoactinomyces sp. DSM 45892]SDY59796.1 RNA-binding protein YlmH, contains S4-like domain [Thermoactinomyces sp. DSM 45892]